MRMRRVCDFRDHRKCFQGPESHHNVVLQAEHRTVPQACHQPSVERVNYNSPVVCCSELQECCTVQETVASGDSMGWTLSLL
ncbi:hypothetical protein AAFF_G00154500 [Aldrovandia affinis]|uniref:Uncharacterized protein n=1 Tax=Aldrovandia affinis TaxID=143900 RepID=A0AAD7SZV5_9TELE|nr:hypothetical protein AAFF_G00154500 [Aldrovandia affinis]